MAPFAAHPDYQYSLEYMDKELKAVGEVANRLGVRLTTHPGAPSPPYPATPLARPLRLGERERLADRCSPRSPSCRPVHAARQSPPGRCRERLPRPRVSQRDDGPHGARQGQRDDHPRASSLARAPFFSGEGSRQANGPRRALQGGGVFGDKAVTLERFKKNYQELSQGVKNRCVLGFLTSAWLASLTCRARTRPASF